MEVEFKRKTKDLKKILKEIKTNQTRSAAYKRRLITFIIKFNKIIVEVGEKVFTIKAYNKEQAIVRVPQFYIDSILKDYKGEKFICKVENGKLTVNKTESINKDIIVEELNEEKDLQEFINKLIDKKGSSNKDASIGLTDTELLWIKDHYSIEELQKNKMLERVSYAQIRKDENVNKSYKLLRVYGVTEQQIKRLVDKAIKNKNLEFDDIVFSVS